MIVIPREICRDLDRALAHEWLVTNGRGSYASSTITGTNTRRYHGLLVAALEPPLGRTVLLSKIDEELEVDSRTYRLGTNEYPNGVVEPNGFLFLQEAVVDGMIPALYFSAASFRLSKTIWMEYGRDTTYIRYQLDPSSAAANLTLLPFCTFRDFHTETQGKPDWIFKIEPLASGFRVKATDDARPYDVRVIKEAESSAVATFTPLNLWYWKFQHRAEAERGLDHSEDLYLPGLLRLHLEPGQSATVVATLEPEESLDRNVNAAFERALEHQQQHGRGAGDDFSRQLFIASDQFLVARSVVNVGQPPANGKRSLTPSTVLAGYHWFGDWGRDTMISLEGLTLITGRSEIARRILITFSKFVSQGMLPNRFPDTGQEPEYNTVDATLWYFHAVDRYTRQSGDQSLLRELYPILRDIIEWHVKGTRFGIQVDAKDGLLRAGGAGTQLTWMDVKVGDWVATPRVGKPVEINALWYNALRLMAEWAVKLGEDGRDFVQWADQAEASFDRFWYKSGGYLYDVIDSPNGKDASLRPNQVFALSLPHSPVPADYARSVLEVVKRELLTPYGLRTLAPGDPNYRGRFTGDRAARDGAYHNGTVWPWLIGAYISAYLRVHGNDETSRTLLEPFEAHLAQAGLGTISECFEGDPPHRPVACIAQAWSVAEVLRAYYATLEP